MKKETNMNADEHEDSSHKELCEEKEENDIDTKVKNKKEFTVQNALILAVAVLVLMSGVQVFQTQQLLAAVSSGAIKASTQTQSGSVGLPSQVGGCG